MRVTGYAYSWDVLEPGFTERITELGVPEVAVALSYHATRAATPNSAVRTAVLAAHSACYRPVRAGAWPDLRPAAPDWLDWLDTTDPAGDAVRVLRDAGVAAAGWLVLTHNSLLGTRHPDLVVRNCFGERYPWALCPGQPRVRDYAATLVAESVRDLELTSLVLESCGPMGAAHQHEHEKTDAVWSPAVLRLLSVCCCAVCSPGETGAAAVRAEVRRLLTDLTGTADALPADLRDTVLGTRQQHTDRLRGAVLAEVPSGTRTVLHGAADPWATGALPGTTPATGSEVDCVVTPGWAADQSGVDGVAAARVALPERVAVGSYLTAVAANPLPDPAGYVRALAAAGADEVHLYHLGLAGPARWPDLRAAVDAARSV